MLPCLVTFTYILLFPHSLGEQPELNVVLIFGFKEFLKPLLLRALMQEEVFAWTSLHNHFPGQLLSCRRSAGRSLQTL